MGWLGRWRRDRRALEAQTRREIDEELALHLERRTADFERRGLDAAEARAEASRRFGDLSRIRSEAIREGVGATRRQSRARAWDAVMQDVRFGVRQALRRPALPAAVVLLLALGVGVNTAVFSVVKAVLLEPLPFDSPEQLVLLWETGARYSRLPVAGSNFLDWRDQSTAFERLVAFSPQPVNLTGAGEPERVLGAEVSPGMFELLRVAPPLGRTLTLEEEGPGAARVAVISDGLWRRRFGADAELLGKTLILDGEPHTLVGITPPGFQHPCPWSEGEKTEVWTPMTRATLSEYGRDGHSFLVLGRLADGVSVAKAQSQMDAIAQRLAAQYPDTNEKSGVRVAPVLGELVGRTGLQLLMLQAAAGLVLLIACGNVAGLLVGRAATRQTEVAVRAALGASRARLVRQLLVENLPVCLVAGGLSLLLAGWGVRLLRAAIPATIPRADQIGIDAGVLGFTLAVSLLAAVAFGLVPALAASRADLVASIKQGRGAVGERRRRLRGLLVAGQLALTLVLANGAALMLQCYGQLSTKDHGFETEGVLTLRMSLSGPRYAEPERVRDFYDDVLERVAALPGVRHSAAITRLPLEGGTSSNATIDGREDSFGDAAGPPVEVRVATPGYFQAMGIPLLAGRTLRPGDGPSGLPGVVVNRTMAELCWPGEDPIGKRFGFDALGKVAVVGVVDDVPQWGLEYEPISAAYLPYTAGAPGMFSFQGVRFLVVRADVDPLSLVSAVRRAIWQVDGDQPISDIRTTHDIVAGSIARRRFNTLLAGLFASIALVLAGAGVYGAMSHDVAQRVREIGVRLALGAGRGRVMRLVLTRGLRLAASGVAVGLMGVLASTRLTASMVYGVSALDPLTLVGGIGFLTSIALLGSLLPAYRATRVAPVIALRDE